MHKEFANIENILVGGKHYKELTANDIQNTYALVECEEPQPDAAGGVFVRSVYMTQHGYNGMLYREGEFCIVMNSQGGRAVLKISEIFSLKISEVYNYFIKGYMYGPGDEEPLRIHPYSGNPVITDAHFTATCLVSQVQRKVMMYPHQTLEDYYIVIDHERPYMPLSPSDVIIPILPENREMVLVMGDNGELWTAHVQSVNNGARTCQVYFYVSKSNNQLFERESGGRLEKVQWDSIVSVATGRWLNSSQFLIQ
jgi:hypothetical protein